MLFHLVLTLEMSEMNAIFVFTTKTTPLSPGLLGQWCINMQKGCTFDIIGSLNAKFFQIWSSVAAGYGEL